MPSESIVKTIGLIIAPVVMITACSIMQNGLIVYYNSLGERLRRVNQEILNLIEADLAQSLTKAELPLDSGTQIRHQDDRLHHWEHHLLPDLFRRHHLLRDVLGLVYLAILTLIFDMLAIAISVITGIEWLSQIVLGLFLIGVGILFVAVILVSYELRTSHASIQLETHGNCLLCKPHSHPHKRSH
jgi:Protein of unknown function (DUF2721)